MLLLFFKWALVLMDRIKFLGVVVFFRGTGLTRNRNGNKQTNREKKREKNKHNLDTNMIL